MISRLLQLKCSSTITIKPGRVLSSSPYCNHRNESSIILLTSLSKSWTMVGLLKILLQLSPDRASQTAFQLTLDLRGTLRAKSNPVTVGDKFNATPSDACSDLPTLPWTCTSHKSGTFVRTRSNTPPALWVGPLTNWEQSATVAKSKAATPWASVMLDLIHSEWWQLKSPKKTKDRCRINRLDAPHSFTKTIKHSVIRTTWASIHNNQITIQPLTWNLSNHEHTTRTLEPFMPQNRKTRANKQRHTKPISRAPLNSRVGAWNQAKAA